MQEAIGDLWTFPAQYRCVTTNGVLNSRGELVMGAGVALEAKKRFPGVPAILGAMVSQKGNIPYLLPLLPDGGLISFPTKNHWRDDSDIDLIRRSAEAIQRLADDFYVKAVVLTRPGCGNGRLSWDDVRPIIADIFDDRFTVVTPPGQTRLSKSAFKLI